VLLYLCEHPEGIDRRTADRELGIGSLSRRICDLLDNGVQIEKKTKTVQTRYSKATRIVVYSLEPETRKAPAAVAYTRPPDKDDRPAPAPSATAKKLAPEIDKNGQRLLF